MSVQFNAEPQTLELIRELIVAIKDTDGIKKIQDNVTVEQAGNVTVEQIENQPITNPVPTSTVVGGEVVDPRDRNWNLDSDEDSVEIGSASVEANEPLNVHDWRNKSQLKEILVELKKMNWQLQVITEEELDQIDLDEVVR